MIITDNHIFVHIPKTGGKSVTEFIDQNKECLSSRSDNFIIKIREPEQGYPLSAKLNYCSHIPVRWVSRYDMEHTYKVKFCTIRNPWDWYISYYFYSNVNHKTFWNGSADNLGLHRPSIQKESVQKFNQWVRNLLNHKYYGHTVKADDDYAIIRRIKHMKKFDIGLYTQVFLDYCLVLDLDDIQKDDLIQSLIDSRLGINKVCKIEALKNDLLDIFKKSKIELQNEDIPHIQKTDRPYPFNFLKSRYDFYEEETKNLIYEKDNLFVEKYGYQF